MMRLPDRTVPVEPRAQRLRLRDLPFDALEVPERLFELDLKGHRRVLDALRFLVTSAA